MTTKAELNKLSREAKTLGVDLNFYLEYLIYKSSMELTLGQDPIGIITGNQFNENSFVKYTNGGTVFDVTYSDNEMLLDIQVSDGSLLNYILFDGWQGARLSYKLSQTWIVEAIGNQTEGLGFTINPQGGDLGSRFNYVLNTGNAANQGAHVWVINNAVAFYGTDTIPVNVGDAIVTTLEKVDNKFIMTSVNLTQGDATVIDEYTYGLTYPQQYVVPAYVRMGICSRGGQQTVKFYEVSTEEVTNCDVLFIGDSKTVGCFAGDNDHTFVHLLKADFPELSIYSSSGAGGSCEDVLNIMKEINSYRPKKVFLFIGCNDVRSNFPYQTYYPILVNRLINMGATVYNMLSAPENIINVVPLNTFITGCPGTLISDSYTLLLNNTLNGLNPLYDAGDGIHINAAGNVILKNVISPYML